MTRTSKPQLYPSGADEGQIRGIHKMLEEDRYSADILGQVRASQEALRVVGRELIRKPTKELPHARHSRAGGEQASAMYDELVELFTADRPQGGMP